MMEGIMRGYLILLLMSDREKLGLLELKLSVYQHEVYLMTQGCMKVACYMLQLLLLHHYVMMM